MREVGFLQDLRSLWMRNLGDGAAPLAWREERWITGASIEEDPSAIDT
jgi:hypothetical protein